MFIRRWKLWLLITAMIFVGVIIVTQHAKQFQCPSSIPSQNINGYVVEGMTGVICDFYHAKQIGWPGYFSFGGDLAASLLWPELFVNIVWNAVAGLLITMCVDWFMMRRIKREKG